MDPPSNEVPGERGGKELIRLLSGRDSEHAAEANDAFSEHAPNVALALRFMRTFIFEREIERDMLFANEAATLLLFGRVYQQLRASTFLALHGYYSEVWGTLRAAYECGSLARYLAKNPERADEWVRKGVWIREREIHRNTPLPRDGFEQLYRHLSEMTHPTLRSSAVLVDTGKDGFGLDLSQPYIERVFENCMENIDAVALWACLALRNSLPSHGHIPPDEQRILEVLAERVAPNRSWSHLRDAWQQALADSEKKVSSARPAHEITEAMRKYIGPLAGQGGTWVGASDPDPPQF